jgi:hypothetical protein
METKTLAVKIEIMPAEAKLPSDASQQSSTKLLEILFWLICGNFWMFTISKDKLTIRVTVKV